MSLNNTENDTFNTVTSGNLCTVRHQSINTINLFHISPSWKAAL